MVEYCLLSKNRKMDEEKWLVCGLTNNYTLGFDHTIENNYIV